jgi:predicted Fe-S protein YdhL (DUF1289 family)
MPEVFHDEAEISCNRCRAVITTWGAFKEHARQTILKELERREPPCSDFARADPLI